MAVTWPHRRSGPAQLRSLCGHWGVVPLWHRTQGPGPHPPCGMLGGRVGVASGQPQGARRCGPCSPWVAGVTSGGVVGPSRCPSPPLIELADFRSLGQVSGGLGFCGGLPRGAAMAASLRGVYLGLPIALCSEGTLALASRYGLLFLT